MSQSLKVIIQITDKCNQNCSYCYVGNEFISGFLSISPIAHFMIVF